MKSIEQTGPAGAGTVTAACVWIAGEPTFELTVHAALLRAMPWFRGGRDVAVLLGGNGMTVMRDGPYRLRALVTNRLDKLPPVRLLIPRLDHLRPEAMPAQPVPHEVIGAGLSITLPSWASPIPSRSSRVVSFSNALAGGVR